MNISQQFEDYKNNSHTRLRIIKTELIIARLSLPFIKLHKREKFLENLTLFLNKEMLQIAGDDINEDMERVDWFYQNCKNDEEVEKMFNEFKFYKLLKFGKNALFVDGLRGEEYRSLEYFNYLIKQYCILSDYVDFQDEKLLAEILSK